MKVGAQLAIGSPGYYAYVRQWDEWSRFHDEQDKLMLMRAREQQLEREACETEAHVVAGI